MYTMGAGEVDAVRRVIESGRLFRFASGHDTETAAFEREWAEKTGSRHAIAVTSGTAALACALAGMGVGPGDEVIVPAYTFMASALAPLAVGAVPVIAEIDESLTLDPADAERKITPRTKAIMPVHMMGLPCDLAPILEMAARRGVPVVEDACQADGGSYGGKRLGSWGKAGAFSFNFYKIISCGEGGALITDDEEVYHRALIFHDGGSSFREGAARIKIPFFAGMNFRMNEILSAVLRVQLRRLDGILAGLRADKRALLGGIGEAPGLRPNPVRDADGDCGVALALLFDTGGEAERFMARLKDLGQASSSPINSGRHVYTNWTPILEKRGAHHPARNPYAYPGVQVEYSKDMCPRTLDILARTVFVPCSPSRLPQDTEALAGLLRAAAKTM